MRPFRLAVVQMRVVGGDRAANLRRAAEGMAVARGRGAEVAVLPEALDLGWTHPSAKTEAESIPGGRACEALREAAVQRGLYVCAGLTERCGEQVFNAAVLIDPEGQVRLHHRKLNELTLGHACYAQGDRLGVVATPLATFGLMICADAFVPGQAIGRTLGYLGADVILSPSAWAVPADHDQARTPYGRLWRDSYGPVARDFRLWIAGVSNVGRLEAGPWAGRKCIGCSLVVGPDGCVALEAPYGEAAETVRVLEVVPEARPARGDGWTGYWAARDEAAGGNGGEAAGSRGGGDRGADGGTGRENDVTGARRIT